MKKLIFNTKISGNFAYTVLRADSSSYVFVIIKTIRKYKDFKEVVKLNLTNEDDYESFIKFKMAFGDELPKDFDSDYDGYGVQFGTDKYFEF